MESIVQCHRDCLSERGRLCCEPRPGGNFTGDVRFSNRPFGVKHFQTVHRCSVLMSLAGSRFSSDSALRPFSNRPFGAKHFQTVHRCSALMSLAGSRFSSDSALRPFQDGIRRRGGTIFGSTFQTDDWFKRTCELTSSIVPRGTSFHHAVELEFSPNN